MPTTTAHCAASVACKDGECHVSDGVCDPKSNADCLQSLGCKEAGYCGLKGDTCVARSEAHCKRSADCKELGMCVLDSKAQECVEKVTP